MIEEYVEGKESFGQDDIEHLAKICFLSLEDAEVCAEHYMGNLYVKEEDKCNRKGNERQEEIKTTRIVK